VDVDTPAAAETAFIAAPVATTVVKTIFVASSRSVGDMSAPMLPIAANAAPGSVNAVVNKSIGLANNSKFDATSAVIITALPFSSVLTSTGVSGGKSE
jgi:hypothetical protein